jgi:hypothetical protein
MPNSTNLTNLTNLTPIQQLTETYLLAAIDLLTEAENIPADTMSIVTKIQTVFLPMAAMHGSIRGQEGLNVKRRILLMGNQATAITLKILEQHGKLAPLEVLDACEKK